MRICMRPRSSTDPINSFVEDGYTLLNLRATWTSLSGSTSVTLYGNNVTDEDYRAEVLPGPILDSADLRRARGCRSRDVL